jgi:hypothetical protein
MNLNGRRPQNIKIGILLALKVTSNGSLPQTITMEYKLGLSCAKLSSSWVS